VNEIQVSSKQMVWLFAISRETLRHWREKGLPYNKKKKSYPLKHCLDWIRKNIWSPRDEHGDINKEKLLRERAKRIQDEFKAEQLSGSLIPKDQAIVWLAALVAQTKQSLQGLARRVAPILALKKDEKDIEIELRGEVRAILLELARPLNATKQDRKHRGSG